MILKRGWMIGAVLIGAVVGGACARAPLLSREKAMRLSGVPTLTDDLPLDQLSAALEGQATLFDMAVLRSDVPAQDLVFGPRRISLIEYARGLRRLAELARLGREKFL